MNYLRIILIVILFITPSLSNDNIPVKYIDLNFIINESIIGKKIKEKII